MIFTYIQIFKESFGVISDFSSEPDLHLYKIHVSVRFY